MANERGSLGTRRLSRGGGLIWWATSGANSTNDLETQLKMDHTRHDLQGEKKP